jgi:twinkle protein
MEITNEDLKKYENLTAVERKIRPSNDFTQETFDFFNLDEAMSGTKLPLSQFDDKFRLRDEEVTVLAGINGAGKSLFASQILLSAMDQGKKCLSISLEMSPKSQLARMWRQASLQNKPDIDAGLEFTKWAKDKLWFYDQHGTITPKALLSVMRYAKDNLDIDIVLIDSLMTMSLNSDDWNGQKQVVQSIANTARHLGIHIILVAHARKGGSVKDRLDKWSVAGSADITNRADNVIILGRLYDDPHADAYMSLCKARHFDGAELDLDLKLDMASLNYYNQGLHPKGILPTPAKGGPAGKLETGGLKEFANENIIRKSKGSKTTAVGKRLAN